MNSIDKIYSNKVGISFFWKRESTILPPKVQLVFRDIGFLLTLNELKDFADSCITTVQTQCCQHCIDHENCRSLLLRTPSDKVDLAVNKKELDQIHELIHETIIRIELKNWVNNFSLN